MSAALARPDDYAAWKRELAGKPRGLATGVAGAGFYEIRTRQGRQPLVIWRDPDGDMVAQIGDREEVLVDERFCEETYARAKAIPEGHYRSVMEGKGWPDEVRMPEPVADVIAPNPDNPHADRANAHPAEHVLLQSQIDELTRDFDKWLKEIGGAVTTQEHADKAASFKARFAELEAKAKSGKAVEKKPVLDEAARLEGLWKPVIGAGEAAKKRAVALIDAFLKAEHARKLAEAAAKAAEGQIVKPAATKVKAGTGKGVSLVSRDVLVIEDAEKAWAHVSALKFFREDPEVIRVFQRVAMACLRNGADVPGAKLTQETNAR